MITCLQLVLADWPYFVTHTVYRAWVRAGLNEFQDAWWGLSVGDFTNQPKKGSATS